MLLVVVLCVNSVDDCRITLKLEVFRSLYYVCNVIDFFAVFL